MATLTVAEVGNAINITIPGDLTTAKVEEKITDAVNVINREAGISITYIGTGNLTCTDAQKPVVKMLAAVYCIIALSGGAAIGLTISLGGASVKQDIAAFIAPFMDEVKRGIKQLIPGADLPIIIANAPLPWE